MRLPLLLAAVSLTCATAGDLRLDAIQAIGSHNSYHLAPPAAVLEAIATFRKDASAAWNYSHPPLARQLDAGVRQFELDLYADPAGGLFAAPLAVKLAALAGKPVRFDPDGALKKPGIKVLHVPDLDCWTNTPSLIAALTEMNAWSLAHPDHLPVMVLLECKAEAHPPLPTRPVPFTRERLLALEKEILSVLPETRILRPDDVRGDEATLPAALRLRGWPTLDTLRGRFLFALDNTDAVRDAYLEGNPALEKRLLFVSAPDDSHPAAAWFKCNDPEREFDRIQRLVKQGFLVRTRSDAGKVDPNMQERAFASGAQWVSSDRFAEDSPARVAFEGGRLVRPNPLRGGGVNQIQP